MENTHNKNQTFKELHSNGDPTSMFKFTTNQLKLVYTPCKLTYSLV